MDHDERTLDGGSRQKSGELTTEQEERLNYIHNTIHEMLCNLAGKKDLEWDIEPIGEISDIAEEHICGKLGIMTEMEFAPYIDATGEGMAGKKRHKPHGDILPVEDYDIRMPETELPVEHHELGGTDNDEEECVRM